MIPGILNVFPNTETYIINWPAGASGSFIASLVAHFVHDDFNSVVSDNGNSHSGKDQIVNNWYIYPDIFARSYTIDQTHLYIAPRDDTKPFILFDHVIPEWDQLSYQYPKFKNIRVTITPNEVIRMFGNLFFKQFVEEYKPNDPTHERWLNVKQFHPYLAKFDRPDEVDEENIKRYLEDCANYHIPEQWTEDCILPEQYKDKITLVKFYDVIYNKDKVLETISDITEKPITDKIEDFYQAYLEKQQKLVNTRMPWLNDK